MWHHRWGKELIVVILTTSMGEFFAYGQVLSKMQWAPRLARSGTALHG